jgi:hypothetical protein
MRIPHQHQPFTLSYSTMGIPHQRLYQVSYADVARTHQTPSSHVNLNPTQIQIHRRHSQTTLKACFDDGVFSANKRLRLMDRVGCVTSSKSNKVTDSVTGRLYSTNSSSLPSPSSSSSHKSESKSEVSPSQIQNLNIPHQAESNSYMSRLKSKLTPYWRLARMHQPTGTYLLFLPCAWSISAASYLSLKSLSIHDTIHIVRYIMSFSYIRCILFVFMNACML